MRRLVLAFLVVVGAVASARADDAADKKEIDSHVEKALAFLQKAQQPDGSWSAARGEENPAITSLSVMAFLSAGHVPGEGKYGATVEKGIRRVLQMQAENGLIATEGGHEMYHHGICTLMLAEAAGMTDGDLGKEIRKKLEKAVLVILKAQRDGNGPERGGWRYQVAHVNGSDMSVTGWQIMALRAAKNVGCDVPADNIAAAVAYIKRSQDSTGGFRYEPNNGVNVACTGTAVLALEICGKDLHRSPETLRGGAYLLKSKPDLNGRFAFYSLYYCSQATFQLGDNYWEFFRPQLHDVLYKNQREDGAWISNASDGAYGPNYCTAMSVLALTVEYRFLPIYQRGEEPTDKK